MTLWRLLAVPLIVLAPLAVTGCGVSDDGDPDQIDLTGTWDLIDIGAGGVAPLELTQTGNTLTGSSALTFAVTGDVSGSTVSMTFTVSTNHVYFTGTLSPDGNGMAGSYTTSSGHTGTFAATRRGTGAGVNMTGTWLSQDLETSTGATMDVTQNGSTLTGVVQGPQATTLLGTIAGGEVTFTLTSVTDTIVWRGYLSVDGNTVTGNWRVEGQVGSHGWRMLRQ